MKWRGLRIKLRNGQGIMTTECLGQAIVRDLQLSRGDSVVLSVNHHAQLSTSRL